MARQKNDAHFLMVGAAVAIATLIQLKQEGALPVVGVGSWWHHLQSASAAGRVAFDLCEIARFDQCSKCMNV